MNTDEACAFVELVATHPKWLDNREKRRMMITIANRIMAGKGKTKMIITKCECASTAKTERQG